MPCSSPRLESPVLSAPDIVPALMRHMLSVPLSLDPALIRTTLYFDPHSNMLFICTVDVQDWTFTLGTIFFKGAGCLI
jgi:hypothetical protein